MPSLLKTNVKRIFVTMSIIFLLCSLIATGLSFTSRASAAASQATVYTSVTKGTMAPVAIADPRHPPVQKAAVIPQMHTNKGERLRPSGSKAASVSMGQVSASALPLAHTGQILQNFNGVGSLDSANTNFGAEFEPPDQGLCAGNGFVIDAVNSAFTIYRTNGQPVLGPLNVNVLFAEGLTQFTSDPRCFFDKPTHTWVAIILFISTDANGNFTNADGRTDIAVNNSGDPTTPWTVYHLEQIDDGTNGTPNHTGCPCFGDQPLIGIDQENFYISTNEFSILGAAANGAQIYPISKSQLFALSNQVHFVHFDQLAIGGTTAFSVQPATTYGKDFFATALDANMGGSTNGEFFLNSLDPNNTFDSRIGVWAVGNRHQVTLGGVPTLSSLVITSQAYGFPPQTGAIQQGSALTLNPDDDRMQQTEFINGNIWGALETAVTIPNDTAERIGVAWFQVHPQISNGVISMAAIVKQGTIASAGNYLLYPAIAAGPDNTAAITYTFTGPNNFPSAAYSVLREGQTSFGDVRIAAAGTGPYSQTAARPATRWGDYSYAVLDPDSNRYWLATEYIPPVGSQTTDAARNWGTRVVEIDGRS
ncbi:MAG TPA: hypothetical protein VKR06_36630 [Ktedonosporobacter sp.]|nr:hypothetical protein [Ktedonosporobacter sp.]